MEWVVQCLMLNQLTPNHHKLTMRKIEWCVNAFWVLNQIIFKLTNNRRKTTVRTHSQITKWRNTEIYTTNELRSDVIQLKYDNECLETSLPKGANDKPQLNELCLFFLFRSFVIYVYHFQSTSSVDPWLKPIYVMLWMQYEPRLILIQVVDIIERKKFTVWIHTK